MYRQDLDIPILPIGPQAVLTHVSKRTYNLFTATVFAIGNTGNDLKHWKSTAAAISPLEATHGINFPEKADVNDK